MNRGALQAAHSATSINIVLFVTKAQAAVIKGSVEAVVLVVFET